MLNNPGSRHLTAVTASHALEAAEARAGVYRLSYDHLAMAVGNYLATLDAGTFDAHEQALANVRAALARNIESYLTDQPATCRCTWLGIGTPDHTPMSLCLTPEQDHANRARFTAASSVPRARTQETAPRTISDARAARAVLGPLRQVVSDEAVELPMAGQWGPYETAQEALLEPLPVALAELRQVGLLSATVPGALQHNTVLAHLVAACEAAGIRRGAFDDEVLERLARWSPVALQAVIGLIRRAYAAGEAAVATS